MNYIQVTKHLGNNIDETLIWHKIVSDHCLIDVDTMLFYISLQWRHNERDVVSNHQPHDCLLNCLFRHKSKKISKLRVTGLCEGNSLLTSEFPTQRASNMENVSI